MSNTLSLLVRPRDSTDRNDILHEVVTVTHGTLVPAASPDVNEYSLAVDGPTVWIDLAAGYDDDGIPDPIPVGKFPWHFNVDQPSEPYWLDVAVRNLRQIFDHLASTGRYDVILTEAEHERILASNVAGHAPES